MKSYKAMILVVAMLGSWDGHGSVIQGLKTPPIIACRRRLVASRLINDIVDKMTSIQIVTLLVKGDTQALESSICVGEDLWD